MIRRGVTMIEVMLCMAVSAAILVGLASAVRLAAVSVEGPTSTTNTMLDTYRALDQLNGDVRVATGFSERTATAITFTVPDRTGDGVAETIRYAWAGAGSPLTRTVNGLPSPAATILENVQTFSLDYLTKTIQPPIVESAEQVLASFTATSGTGVPISSTNWESEYFMPTFPANAISWKITKIRLTMRQLVAAKNVDFSVSNVDGSFKPTGTPLETYTKSTSTISTTATAYDIPFSNLAGLSPTQGKSFQVKTAEATAPINLRNQATVSPPTTGMSFSTSTNGGSTWSTPTGATAIEFQVYGTITTQGN